jgi:23S rRNA (adenine2503-C2)-methyltransferase
VKILSVRGRESLAVLYVGSLGEGKLVECVESLEPPTPRREKWVLIVSSLFGCPVRCGMCDAGGSYRGKLSAAEILAQIDFLVDRRFPGREVPVEKFKVQFARMGEPALNASVLEVLEALPSRYRAPGLFPALSTVAPAGSSEFFETLLDVKDRLYRQRFQLQFSIHTTDEKQRDALIPFPKWSLAEIARYGENFHRTGERKVSLNFSLMKEMSVDPGVLGRLFDPAHFVIKLTPLNPTKAVLRSSLHSRFDPDDAAGARAAVEMLEESGLRVILSIGETEENAIGTNCGQAAASVL